MNQFQKDQVQDMYYLSPMQEGMLFHTLLHPGQGFYIEQIRMQVDGLLRTDLLEQSMAAIGERHDIFRTVFVHEKVKRPVQVVLKQRTMKVREIDIQGLSAGQQEEYIRAYMKQDKETGFDLSKDIPMRTAVFKKGDNSCDWVWSYHHMLLDGWCFGFVVQELFQIYGALLHNRPYALPPVKPYKEYIRWLEKQDKQQSLQYWNGYLSGFEGQTTFAEQRTKDRRAGHDAQEAHFRLTEEETGALSRLAQEQGVTLSTALQAVWAVMLGRYQRSDDVVFGTVVSGRPAEITGVENMVGLFINVVPTRVSLQPDLSFAELLSSMQRRSLESEAHQYVPLYDIQSLSAMPELVDHIVVFENYPQHQASGSAEDSGLGFTIGSTGVFEKSNYGFNLLASPGKELLLKIAYNANEYDRTFITRLKEQLQGMIRQIGLSPEVKLGHIRVVTTEEERLLLEQFNAAATEAPNGLMLHEWFERYAEETPDHIALACGDLTFTYAELNARANRLARLLRHKGVTRGSVVGLLVRRSPDMVVGMMAVLKAQGAYVPVDPDYPEPRIRFMLEDSGSQLLLLQRDLSPLADAVSFEGVQLFFDDPALSGADAGNLESAGKADDLAYIMYTSGTTGNPKGILTSQANILRVVKNTNYIDIDAGDTLLSVSNYAFDGFTFDLFGALLNGAKLVIAPTETILHTGKLMRLIQDERISVMFVTTALFNLLVDSGHQWMHSLRKVLFGGERSSVGHVRQALRRMGPGKIIHVYGPTETTVFATYYPVSEIPMNAAAIPIGGPINSTGAYILGLENQLQPLEAAGELCISGAGVAGGYLNRPDLTEAKFVPHPFIPGQTLYRTGDLARWLPDGYIEFLGRIDDQVKIRGHRIELGEIEQQLLRHPGVKEAFVLADSGDSGETTLCAYVVGEAESGLTPGELQLHLAKALPGYMVPPACFVLDRLPLTPNGKVNRRLLPKASERLSESADRVLPRNELESRLAELWSEVLNVPNVGIHDNFFALGGHSLKAMALSAQMLKALQTDVPVRLLFEHPTIAGIAGYLQSCNETAAGLSQHGTDGAITVLNPESGPNLFVFPPVTGYGIMYGGLAQHLPQCRLIAFDFIEEEGRVQRYAETMLGLQPDGPFIMLGYSAGCGLAFEVAKALEKQGRSVDALIMTDSYKKTGISDLEGRSVDRDVDMLMEANKDNPYLQIESVRQGIVSKMTAYYAYFVNLVNSGQVSAPIHFIRSDSVIELPPWMSSWQDATTASYFEHQGYGKHDEMMQGAFAESNASLIRRILHEAESEQHRSHVQMEAAEV